MSSAQPTLSSGGNANIRKDSDTLSRVLGPTLPWVSLASCQRDTIVVSHDAFGYLARYGLTIEAISGLSPGAEPSPADLARLQELVHDEGITTVFSERLASPRLAETLASDTGVRTEVLDPVEGLADATADRDYLDLMRANLRSLKEANGC